MAAKKSKPRAKARSRTGVQKNETELRAGLKRLLKTMGGAADKATGKLKSKPKAKAKPKAKKRSRTGVQMNETEFRAAAKRRKRKKS